MTFRLVETKTLATAAASIEFTSIPQDATDLMLLVSARNSAANIAGYFTLSFNGSTASFDSKGVFGNGSAPATFIVAGFGGEAVGGSSTANTFGNSNLYIMNYTHSLRKSYSVEGVGENNGTTANQTIGGGYRDNSAAITSITLTSSAGNFAIGTSVSLYKITKGSSGGVVVS